MVILGGYFLLFIVALIMEKKKTFGQKRWIQEVAWTTSIGLHLRTSRLVVAEAGRQPWAIKIFCRRTPLFRSSRHHRYKPHSLCFLIFFTLLLIADIGIMVKTVPQRSGRIKRFERHYKFIRLWRVTYILLQQYWWFLISLLGALLVFLLFVQGGQSMLFPSVGTRHSKNADQ